MCLSGITAALRCSPSHSAHHWVWVGLFSLPQLASLIIRGARARAELELNQLMLTVKTLDPRSAVNQKVNNNISLFTVSCAVSASVN